MESNLSKLFKTDKGLEKNGIWYEVGEAKFLIKRMGGANAENVKRSMSKFYKPFARQIELGVLPDEISKQVMVKLFVDSCLMNWEGVVVDEKPYPYSFENAVALLSELPDLLDLLTKLATEGENYREDLGNS